MIELSALGICGVLFFVILTVLFIVMLATGGFDDEAGGAALLGIAVMIFFICWIPVKYHITPIPATDRAVVGNHVVFVVDGEVKSYNDIETMKNMNNVKFKKSISINIFEYEIDNTITRK